MSALSPGAVARSTTHGEQNTVPNKRDGESATHVWGGMYNEHLRIPPAETSEVKATLDGKIVHRSTAPKQYMTVTAFLGRPSSVTRPTQEENGKTPSRATAKTSRDAATVAILAFRIRPTTARMVMKTEGPFPSASA
ncbi:hypothetical protein QFC19_008185 [Naganishia cerealis]|uniref:Uncharacterized protein n=1 Tax=Naganishia cerealis TaxID=610337 RepID=A0ACC2V3X1_9TREE|nr:hypothetical protein QFC19_008185 [Naganishia cerealis]